jgi:tetratricopeptide (TPR) repeat protein
MIEIQENVAIEIAKALQTAMDPDALAEMVSAGTSSIPAYEAYLQGLAYGIDSETTGDVYEYVGSRDAFERAIELDPKFAQAHWQLAFFWSDLMSPSSFSFHILETPMDEMRTMFIDSIQNAIRYENVPASRAKYRSLQAEFNGRPGQALQFTTEYLSHRPNDDESQLKMMNLQSQLGLVDELTASIRDFVERSPHNSLVNDQALLLSLQTGDDELTREIAHNALRNIPDSIFVKYQSHRALLWIGDIDDASRLLPALRNSDYGEKILDLIEIRQACAENRLDDAAALMADLQSRDEQDNWTQWFVLHMSDRQDEAVEFLRPFDEAGDFAAMYVFAPYAYFDPRPYTNFMAHRRSEGGVSNAPIEIPYRCKFPESGT